MKSPHLPPKTCNIELHKKIQTLPWMLFVVLLAFISGVTAALATVAWIAPIVVVDQPLFSLGNNRQVTQVEIDPLILRQSKQRLLTVYDKRKKVADKFYSDEDILFQAMLLSSDGWAVAYYSSHVSGESKNWEIIDYQGVSYNPEKVFKDPVSNLLYLNVDGNSFRITSFVDWNEIAVETDFWSLSGRDEKYIFVKDLVKKDLDKARPIWQPQYDYELSEELAIGSLLLDGSGRLAGFVGENKEVVASWYIEQQVSSVLSKGTVEYSSLPVKGYIVKDALQQQPGFYVTVSPTKSTSSTLGVGDIVLLVDNKPVDSPDFARHIFLAPDSVEVRLLRKGEEVGIMVKKDVIE